MAINRRALIASLRSGILLCADPGTARSLSAQGSGQVIVPDTFSLYSPALGERRHINAYTPPNYRASVTGRATRLPVLYMPDGAMDEDFPHVTKTVDSLIALGQIRPVIVVGIPNTERRRDLSPPTRNKSDSAIAPQVGGSAAFRTFVRQELIPEIDRRYHTTSERGIVGESLAGLFAMQTFLEEPALFAHYIILDPSLWWNAGALVDSAATRIKKFNASPRTLYLATSKEPSTYVGSAKIVELLRAARPRGLRFTYEPRTDLGHDNIFLSLQAAALLYVFRQE